MIINRTLLLGAAVALPCAAHAQDAPKIVTDIAPLASLALMIEPDAEVTVLAQDADPHHVTLRPSDIRALTNADLVVWMGGTFSHWLADALSVTPLKSPDLALSDTVDHEWLDPIAAARWTGTISDALGSAFPDDADTYQAASNRAQAELVKLEAEISATLAPYSTLGLLTAHDAYGTFASRFDLNIIGSISNAHDEKPSAAKLAKLNRMVRDGHVDCIFEDAGEHDEAAHMLADASGIFEGVLDPLGSGDVGPNSYAKVISGIASEITACAAAAGVN